MAETGVELPEFHIVVRRPGRGPLAPYRFVIVIGFALALTWRDLWNAALAGTEADAGLARAAIAGTLAWFVLGRVNSILKGAQRPAARPASEIPAGAIDRPQ